jgi:hypothetical protein
LYSVLGIETKGALCMLASTTELHPQNSHPAFITQIQIPMQL